MILKLNMLILYLTTQSKSLSIMNMNLNFIISHIIKILFIFVTVSNIANYISTLWRNQRSHTSAWMIKIAFVPASLNVSLNLFFISTKLRSVVQIIIRYCFNINRMCYITFISKNYLGKRFYKLLNTTYYIFINTSF